MYFIIPNIKFNNPPIVRLIRWWVERRNNVFNLFNKCQFKSSCELEDMYFIYSSMTISIKHPKPKGMVYTMYEK